MDAPMASSAGEALERGANIGKLLILGDAASDNIDVIERIASGSTSGRRREWAIGQSPDLLAHLVARVALARYSLGESADPGEVKACYVRPAQAVTKLALGLVGPGLRP